MDTFLRFLAKNEPLVYILLALAGLFAGRHLLRAWREWRASIFVLERQVTFQRMIRSALQLGGLVLLALGEVFLVSFLVPARGALDVLPTPTVDLLAPSVAETPSAGAAAPGAALPDETGCQPGRIEISQPRNGAQVGKQVTLIGTADIENFGFYKFEMSPLGAEQWVTILAGREPVRDGELGRWNTSTLTPGDYALRLVVMDAQGQALQPCQIILRVGTP